VGFPEFALGPAQIFLLLGAIAFCAKLQNQRGARSTQPFQSATVGSQSTISCNQGTLARLYPIERKDARSWKALFTKEKPMSHPPLRLFSIKQQIPYTKLVTFTTALGLIFATGEAAKAATLTALNQGTVVDTFTECINDGIALMIGKNPADEHGWQYAIDSFNDGVSGTQIGGNVYEIYSLALRETSDSLWVVINGNLPLTGTDAVGAEDGNIGWGDLFFNFSGKDFTTASKEGSLFAVRYAGTNDSFVPEIGLYGNVTATSTTAINSGFSSIKAYNQRVTNYCQEPGCGPSLGDLAADASYFDQTQSLNAIASGKFLTSIMYLSDAELLKAGYDLNRFGGQHTIAFKFNKSGICESGYCKSVPEPSGVLGLAAVGLIFGGSKLRKRYKDNSLKQK
jgi:hypothetical protein